MLPSISINNLLQKGKQMKSLQIKPKRTRRTKKEMDAVRAHEAEWGRKIGKDALKPKKYSHKSDMEAEHPILEPTEGVISGWVNVYNFSKGSYTLGCDIHYTVDDAKKIGTHNKYYLKTIYISFEDTP
jgi:hypothetical protein